MHGTADRWVTLLVIISAAKKAIVTRKYVLQMKKQRRACEVDYGGYLFSKVGS